MSEKDGLWAVLFWLNLIAVKKQSISQIVTDHWARFGQNYYCRHDYEAIDSQIADDLMQHLVDSLDQLQGQSFGNYQIENCDNFSYTDPVDNSVSSNQGIRLLFSDGSRIVYRLSGTGTEGATLRVYIEKYEPDVSQQNGDTQLVLSELIEIANTVAQILTRTGRTTPDVIT